MNSQLRAMCFELWDVPCSPEYQYVAHEQERNIKSCIERKIPYFVIILNPYYVTSDNISVRIPFAVHPSMPISYFPAGDLGQCRVLLRSWQTPTTFALDAIERAGGINETSPVDADIVLNWPINVLPEYLKREVGITTANDLASVASSYADTRNVFVKTQDKLIAGHGTLATLEEIASMKGKGLPFVSFQGEREFMGIPETEPLIVSQPVYFEKDDKGNCEYRTWVVGHKVAAIARYDYPDDLQVPAQVSEFAKRFVKTHINCLPPNYVADIGIAKQLGCVVIELNDIVRAGDAGTKVFNLILDAYIGNKH